MLTGSPPLGHLEPAAAIFRIGSKPTKPKLPGSVSEDAEDFIKAALTWFVLKQGHNYYVSAMWLSWWVGLVLKITQCYI